MGKTFREAVAIVMAQYEAVWKKAEREYEKYGEVSDKTHRLLADIELELEMLGA